MKCQTVFLLVLFSLLLEKLFQQGFGFQGSYARYHFSLWVEYLFRNGGESTLWVGGAVNYASNLRPCKGSGTHHAGLEGDVQSAVGEVLAANGLCRRGYGYHLGVGRYVVQQFGAVVAAGYYLAVAHYHRPDGNLVLVVGRAGFLQGLAHVIFINSIHVWFRDVENPFF